MRATRGPGSAAMAGGGVRSGSTSGWRWGFVLLLLLAALPACGPGRLPTMEPSPTASVATPVPTATATPTPVPPAHTRSPAPPPGPELLPPNLRPLPPDEVYIQRDEVTGIRELRFSTLVANVGRGRLTLIGTLDPETMVSRAVQVIALAAGGTIEEPVGSFVISETHQHWHFEDFMIFELWSVTDYGDLFRLLTSTGKLTFCIVDFYPVRFEFPEIDSNPLAAECGSDLQGISVGWVDVYTADLPGQDLDLGDLPDAIYAIRTIIDPDGRIYESDTADNEEITYVRIEGFFVEILPSPAAGGGLGRAGSRQ